MGRQDTVKEGTGRERRDNTGWNYFLKLSCIALYSMEELHHHDRDHPGNDESQAKDQLMIFDEKEEDRWELNN